MPIEAQVNIALQTEPVAPDHLVTMQWVTDFVIGKVKAPVFVVATANQVGTYNGTAKTFSYTAMDQPSIDDRFASVGDRVLFVGQSDARQNGIYVVTVAGNPTTPAVFTRAADWDRSDQIFTGVTIGVNAGSLNQNTHWKLTTEAPITLDTSALAFLKLTPSQGARRYAAPISGIDGTETDFEIPHNFGTRNVVIQVFNDTTDNLVLTDIIRPSSAYCVVRFAEPPPVGSNYSVCVVG